MDFAISLMHNSEVELKRQETLEILESDHIKFLVTLTKMLKPLKPRFLYNSGVFESLVDQMTKPMLLLDAVFLIRKIPAKFTTEKNLSHIIRTLRSLLSLHDDNTMIEHWNPTLVSVACSELCKKLAKYSFEFRYSFEQMRTRFKALADLYVSKFSEFCKVHLIYTDDSYPGGTLLDLMTANSAEYRMMLESNLVAVVVEQLWSGNAKNVMMHHASPLYQIYASKNPVKVFQIHKSDKMKLKVDCYFSYSAWKLSAEMRFWLETLYLVAVLIRVVVTIQKFTKYQLIILSWNQLPQDREDAAKGLDDEKPILWMCFCFLLVTQLRTIYDAIYQHLKGDKVVLTARVILDFSLLGLMAAAVDKVENHETETDKIEELFAGILLLICIKGCMIMLITKRFGPVVRSISIIVINAVKYFMLFFLSMFGFTLVFNVLFYRQDPSFETLGSSFKVLFDFSTGNIDFHIFGDRDELGGVLTIAWTFVSMIIILNIIIAFITNRYSNMEPQANADYASLLYSSYKTYQFDKHYSSLVMFPVPTNLILVLLSPLYLVLPNTRRLNSVLMRISYLQMFVLALTLFTLYNVLMVPVVYFKTAVRLLSYTRRNRKYLGTYLEWIFFGLFYEVFLCVVAYRYVVPLLLTYKVQPVKYELSAEMIDETLKVAHQLSKDIETPVIVPLNDILKVLSHKEEVARFVDRIIVKVHRMTKKASLTRDVIKDFQLCNQIEFIEQFLWYDVHDKKQQKVNLTLLQQMVKDLAFNSSRLIPVNVSGIQRALGKFKKTSTKATKKID
jgi:hypothetical protein